jgi:hypothetical protein
MTDFDRSPITANPARPAAAGIPPADSTPTAKQRRRWLRFLILLAAVAGLWWAHGPVLRSVGGLLVSDEPVGQYQYVGLCGRDSGPDGDRAYDAAAALFRQHPSCHILVIQTAALRLVETGILASLATLSRRELAARGVPAHTLVATSRDGGDDWATARALRVWLSDHPTDSIVLLCARFRSAYLRHALSAVLDSSQAARVRLHALRDRRCDETDWWKSRTGYKAFGMECLRHLHTWCVGGGHPMPPLQSADDYERSFRLTLSEATR